MLSQLQFDDVIRRLRSQGREDSTLEVKSCADGIGKSAWESISAFANTSGGILLLGISEEAGFTPVPDFDPERVSQQLIGGLGDGGAQAVLLTNPPRYNISTHPLDEATVLAVEICENPPRSKPCFVTAKGPVDGGFRRVDDHDVRLSRTEVFEMETIGTPSTADRDLVPECGLDDLDPSLVDAMLVAVASDSRVLLGTTTPESKLTRLNVMSAVGGIRLAGLLAVGIYPQQFFPRLHVDVAVHPTNTKGADTPMRFLDRAECRGPISVMVSDAVRAVLRNLRTYSLVEETKRVDEPEIPEVVLREAIANAVVHREYAPLFVGQPVVVDVYPDRVCVTSPGGLWGGRTRENLGDGVSECRNQTLVQLLKHAPELGAGGKIVEGNGSGIPLMNSAMHARSLEGPDFHVTPAEVRLTLRRHGAELESHRRWVQESIGRTVNRHEDAVLAIARREGEVCVGRARELLGLDSDEARAVLGHLASEGALTAVGDEIFVVADEQPRRRAGEQAVLDALAGRDPLSIHDLAAATGRAAGSVRPILRNLVAAGSVIATAPPQSRNRRYRLP